MNELGQRKVIFLIIFFLVFGLVLSYAEKNNLCGVNDFVGLDKEDFEEVCYQTCKTEKLSTININTANKELLCKIPGIGPVTAQRIIDYRIKHGLFRSKEGLLKVKGIGDKKIEKIVEFISLK